MNHRCVPIPVDLAIRGATMFGLALDGSPTVDPDILEELWRAARRAQSRKSLLIVYADGEIETSAGAVVRGDRRVLDVIRFLARHVSATAEDIRDSVWSGNISVDTVKRYIRFARDVLIEHDLDITKNGVSYSITKLS